MSNRVIMLVDFDYFFAQCEELRNPALKNKPVVVGVYSGRTEDSGAVSTANYIAREYGVRSGISLHLAKKKLEGTDAVFLPVDHAFYEQISQKIMQVLKTYADSFEEVGVDEAYLDVTQTLQGNYEEATNLVQKIRDHAKKQAEITFSIGIGPNKLVAKIACDIRKPNGLTIIKPEDVQTFLSPLPVKRLLGVGRKTSLKMEEMGITTIGDLAGYDVQKLMVIFGKKLSRYFHDAANGVDKGPVREIGDPESISRISTLKEDTRDLNVILAKVNELIEDLKPQIFGENISFRQIGIIAVMTDLSIRNKSQTLELPTKEITVLKKTVGELFVKLLGDLHLEIRRVGVKISNLAKEDIEQKRLTSFF